MKRGTRTQVEIDGVWFPAKFLGKGAYSKVFQVGNRAVMYTRGDCAKKVLAMYLYDRLAHLPEIVQHENVYGLRGDPWHVFSSPFYRDVTRKDKSAYELMTKMIRFYNKHGGDAPLGIRGMQYFVNTMKEELDFDNMYRPVKAFPRSVIRAMQELVNVSSGCGGKISFDIHQKNFGVNDYGTLIFRDIVNPATAS